MIKTLALASGAALIGLAAPAQATSPFIGQCCRVGDDFALDAPVVSRNDAQAAERTAAGPTVQRLDPLAVRLPNGTLVAATERPTGGGGFINNGPTVNGIVPSVASLSGNLTPAAAPSPCPGCTWAAR